MEMKKVQKGFTLIELMIVVAIIGILAAIAIPAYQDYTQRAQIGEAFTLVSAAKTGIAEFAQSNGAYPNAAALTDMDLGGTINGKYSSFAVGNNGVITVTMAAAGVVGADVAGKTVTFTPPNLTNLSGAFTWTCTSNADNKFLPANCRAAAANP